MQQSAHIKLAIDLFDIFFQSFAPFDIVMSKFFKNNKWIGSSDRREIANFSYSIFRNYETIKFYTSKITNCFGRFYVMTFFSVIEKYSYDKINEIFSGKPHCPSKLTEFEKNFLLSIDDKKELPLHAKLNYPEWLDPYLKNAFNEQNKFDPEQFENEILALNGKACVDIRINTLKSNKEDVKKLLQESGFRFEDTPYSQNGIRILGKRIGRSHEIISDGLAEIQDEGSQLVAEVCNVSPTDTVIDFCAGAGGKTLAISASMSNKGRIFALDRDVKRLEKAKLRFRRANVNNVYCQEITSKWIKRHTGCADVVLVDAPCSGTGTWRRNPDMRAKFSQNDLDELIALQAEILSRASNLVKIGGKLVYATCSILKEENEYQIDKFLAKNINFVIKKINLEKTGLINANYLRLSTFRHGTDGFFSVCLEKKC